MSRAIFQPVAGRASEILDFIMHTPEVRTCPSLSYAVRLACEEVVVNILHYAYSPGVDGYIKLEITLAGRKLRVELRDGGLPFNPVERENPDVTLQPEKREVGGLGIFLVLQVMDEVVYRYEDGENILVLIKEVKRKSSNG